MKILYKNFQNTQTTEVAKNIEIIILIKPTKENNTMALDQASIPLTGDLLDDLAMAFRELITKVCYNSN